MSAVICLLVQRERNSSNVSDHYLPLHSMDAGVQANTFSVLTPRTSPSSSSQSSSVPSSLVSSLARSVRSGAGRKGAYGGFGA